MFTVNLWKRNPIKVVCSSKINEKQIVKNKFFGYSVKTFKFFGRLNYFLYHFVIFVYKPIPITNNLKF